MALQVLVPDGLVSNTGHSSCLLSDLTGDDGNWCIAASKTVNTTSHVDFPTPAVPLGVGGSRQKILAKVRQFSGNDAALPTARIELWENGSLVRAGSNITVPVSGSRTLTLLFNANELSSQDGSLVQVKVITTADTEPGFSGSVDTGFIEFTADSLNSDSITGSITTTFTPAASLLSFNNAHEISGSVTTSFTPSATMLHKQNLAIVGDITVDITVDASLFFTVFGSRETLLPDGLIADSGHSACLLSDLTADDANWCVAASITSNTEMHVNFPTPTNLLEVGANFQKITAIIRQNASNEPSSPTARIELWEGGSLVRAGSNFNIPQAGVRTISLNFNANELADVHGQNVQAKVITVADTEPGFSGAVDTGYIAFDAKIIPLNFYSISGSISTSFTPGATTNFEQHPQITGDVTATFTPAATLLFTGHAQIIGDVTVNFLIAAMMLITRQSYSITGSVTTSFTPGATLSFAEFNTIAGDVTTTFIPAAAMGFHPFILFSGSVTTTFVPAATLDYQKHPSFVGSVSTSFIPSAGLLFAEKGTIVGNITTTITPGAVMDFTDHPFLGGSITVSFLINATLFFLPVDLYASASPEKLKLVSLTPRRRFKFFQRSR